MKGLSKLLLLITILVLILVISIISFILYDQTGTSIYSFGFSKDKAILAETSVSFFEDLQFKDFGQSARYHSPEDQESVDIPKLIERIFFIKPEILDIQRYRVLDINIDSSGNRARVFMSVFFRVLNTDKEAEKDLILYYFKDHRDTWYMKLESSLR